MKAAHRLPPRAPGVGSAAVGAASGRVNSRDRWAREPALQFPIVEPMDVPPPAEARPCACASSMLRTKPDAEPLTISLLEQEEVPPELFCAHDVPAAEPPAMPSPTTEAPTAAPADGHRNQVDWPRLDALVSPEVLSPSVETLARGSPPARTTKSTGSQTAGAPLSLPSGEAWLLRPAPAETCHLRRDLLQGRPVQLTQPRGILVAHTHNLLRRQLPRAQSLAARATLDIYRHSRPGRSHSRLPRHARHAAAGDATVGARDRQQHHRAGGCDEGHWRQRHRH
eukprot:scaffold1487_cov116-Isochrysis_galbana.AAC.15